MAKTKFKLGQTLETAEQFGRVDEIRIKTDTVTYVLHDGGEVVEKDVTAVYRAVTPRSPKPRAAKAAGGRSGKKNAENRAAA